MIRENELIIGKYYKTNIEFTGSLEAKINVFKNKEYFILNKKNLLLILQFDLFKFIEPIPITEDILLKFPRWFRYLIDDGYFNLNETHKGYVDVKYLHTAQNLYFALTGEELTINL